MKRRKLSLLFIAIVIIALFSGFLYYKDYFIDKYYVIKPLPAEIPIKIRIDAYGDGHFGAPRNGYRHRGIDILADVGTYVLACKSGRVSRVNYDNLSGNYIIIKHRDNLSSYYLHLKDVYVKEKQLVKQGQIIATVGKTGNARHKGIKPHLHFEIRKDNIAQDVLKVYDLKPLTEHKMESTIDSNF